jgi:predicted DCC family thiol-disulfide oxidoreductase YuxK
MNTNHKIVLFDGVCNFCNSSVNFIIDHDKHNRFKFAALQTEAGQELLKKHNLPTEDFDSFILVDGDRYYKKSSASLHTVKEFPGLWKLLYAFIIVPPFIRDIFYNIIAKNRYKWFGKRDECRMPTKELREKFL